MKNICALTLFALPMFAQVDITASPANYNLFETVWNVSACVKNSAAPSVVLRGGDIYAEFTKRKIVWFTQTQAVGALQATPEKSLPAKLVKYGGYASAAAAFLLGTNIVKAKAAYTGALTAASGAINVVVPLAQKAEPPVPTDVQSGLIGPFLVVPVGGCATGIIVGGSGDAFKTTIP